MALIDFDTIISSPQGPGLLADITRLYLVVLGRPPDLEGLRAYIAHMANGTPLPVLVEAFLGSDEFRSQVGAGSPEAVLWRHAYADAAMPADRPLAPSLCEFATALIVSRAAAERLPVLPALFPDGLVLRDAADYRVWLAGRPAEEQDTMAAASASFVMVLQGRDPLGMAETLRSVLAHPWLGLEILLCSWRFGPDAVAIAATDTRIRLIRMPFCYNATAQFNHALRRCRGRFTGLIEAGERLDVRAASRIAEAMQRADIVLSDEDSIDVAGLRHSPRLGDAWDPDRMLGTGRPGLLLARTTLLHQTGGLSRNGGTTADLLLRAALRTEPDRIVHVPALWLSRPGLPPLPGPMQVKAALAYLEASNQPGRTVSLLQGTVRVIHPLPRTPVGASIIIATRNRAELLSNCVDGLLNRTDYPAMEVVIVDNGSDEPAALSLLRTLACDSRVRILSQPGPFNWAALNNAGVAQMAAQVAVLLNNDTEVLEAGWLREMVSQAIRPGVGAVGAKLLYPDYTVQHAGVVLDTKGHALHMWRRSPGGEPGYLNSLAITREVTAVTGACLAIRREIYDAIGGCHAENLPVTWNDVDLCLRVRAHGLRVIWTPHACLLHVEQASRGSDDTRRTMPASGASRPGCGSVGRQR